MRRQTKHIAVWAGAFLVGAMVPALQLVAFGATINEIVARDGLDANSILDGQQEVVGVAGGVLTGVDPNLGNSQRVIASLDLYYADRADPASGGTWQLLAIASNEGVAGLDTALFGVDPSPTFDAPQPAFLEFFADKPFFIDQDGDAATIDMLFAQVPTAAPGPQTLQYGVGVLGGSTPRVDILESRNPSAASMHDGALLASGTFMPGAAPTFVNNGTEAAIFTARGTDAIAPPVGSIQMALVTTQIRTNQLIPEPSALALGVIACVASRRTRRRAPRD